MSFSVPPLPPPPPQISIPFKPITEHELTIEKITDETSAHLWEFLAIAAHEDNIKEVQSNPSLSQYVNDFDPNKDFGWIAIANEKQIVGAAWARFWDTPSRKGFAYISKTIPELALGVHYEYQGKGIGSALLQKLIDHASSSKEPTIPALSLSVRDTNPAFRLYQRFGFRSLSSVSNRVGGQSFTMIKLLDPTMIVLRSILTKNDLPNLLSLIRKKAEFDQTMLVHSSSFSSMTPLTVTEDKLEKALFQQEPCRLYAILAEQLDREPMGMALYYFRFSSFSGQPSIWLEDLYVDVEFRRNSSNQQQEQERINTSNSGGVGARLMHKLADLGQEKNCTHIGWTMSARNVVGFAFYNSLDPDQITSELYGNQYMFKWDLTKR